MGYTKLFSEIIMSTVWREPNHVRILWITMLALKDRWHVVNASLPGLADAAKISIQEAEDAIRILSSPDHYSRSHESEGRRIEPCDGGWIVINGEKYRNKMSLDERREYNRIKQRQYREQSKEVSKSCVQSGTESAHTETETETETEARKKNNVASLVSDFENLWSGFDQSLGDKGSKKNALAQFKKLKPDQDLCTKMLSALSAQIENKKDLGRRGQFVAPFQHVERWLKNERWNDDLSTQSKLGSGNGQRINPADEALYAKYPHLRPQ